MKYGRLLVDINGRGNVTIRGKHYSKTVNKTTLLKVPAGLYSITAKDIVWEGTLYERRRYLVRKYVRAGSYKVATVRYRAVIPNHPLPDDTRIQEMYALVNQVRAGGYGPYKPAPPLKYNVDLSGAAYGHAVDMATHNYFSHNSQDGRTFEDRVKTTSFPGDPASENIASGFPTVEDTVTGWLNSPEHCKNMMNPDLDYVGYGYAERQFSGHSSVISYWVQDFGYKPTYY